MSSSTSTSTSDNTNEKNKDTALPPFQVQKRDILFSDSTRYLVMDFNGEGCFGKVAKCVNLTTAKMVAIKIHKKSEDHVIQREVEMLEALRALNPERKNIVRFMDNFRFHNLSCLAFEMLDRSLWDLIKEKKWMPLSLNEIRPVTHQLLIAFKALKDIGILHTDLKPDNIMLVNHKDQPFRVKLIDFGLALPVSKVQIGMTMQARAYRAPEVTLGLPLSEAVDMWGVGCIMAFLYFGANLFPGNCAYNSMTAMVHLLGQPEDHLLSAGKNTMQYFSRKEGSISPGWRLKSPEEYKEATGVDPKVLRRFFDLARNLDDAVQRCPAKRDAVEYEDRMAFLSLLKWCLHLDPGRRATPRKGLKHTFVTMVHLVDKMDTNSYADAALQFMTVSPLDNLDESSDSHSDTETNMELRDDQTSDSSDEVSGTESSSNEESAPRPLKTDLKREPSSAIFCERDSLTDSSSGENEYIESFSEESSDIERSVAGDSDTESSSGNDADIDTSSDEDDLEPATSDSYDGDPSIPSFSDEKAIEPASTHSYDRSSFILCFSDEIKVTTSDSYGGHSSIPSSTARDDIEPVHSDSYSGSSFILHFSDEYSIEPSKSCFNFDEVSAPTALMNGSSTSRDGHSGAFISNHETSIGAKAAIDFYGGVGDNATPTKEESGTAAPSNDDNTDANNKDSTSAAAGSTDGAAASISSNDGAPVDVDEKKRKTKNLLQRTCKLYCQVKARVMSIFKR